MITDRYLGFRFDDALALVNQTRRSLASALSDEAMAILDRMEAHVLYVNMCSVFLLRCYSIFSFPKLL